MSATLDLDGVAAAQEAVRPGSAPDFDRFRDQLAAVLQRDLHGATRSSRLADDLGWDSLAMLEALAVLDGYGVRLPEELVGELRTLGDLHHYLRVLVATPGADALGEAAAPRHDAFRGPNVALAPVTDRDLDWLYPLCATGQHLVRFRLRGVTPSPDTFRRFLWDQVLVQFAVTTHDGRPIGLVTCFEPNFRNRYAYLAAVADPAFVDQGLVLEGLTLLISYVFSQFDLRKLYAESLDRDFRRYASGAGRVFDVEGRLREHEYVDGAYEDYVVSAVWRRAWREHHRRVLGTVPPF